MTRRVDPKDVWGADSSKVLSLLSISKLEREVSIYLPSLYNLANKVQVCRFGKCLICKEKFVITYRHRMSPLGGALNTD